MKFHLIRRLANIFVFNIFIQWMYVPLQSPIGGSLSRMQPIQLFKFARLLVSERKQLQNVPNDQQLVDELLSSQPKVKHTHEFL